MRILANSEHLSPNTGISVQTLEVTEELARRGHQLDLVYMRDGPYRPRYEAFCHSMHEIPLLDLGVHHCPSRRAPNWCRRSGRHQEPSRGGLR